MLIFLCQIKIVLFFRFSLRKLSTDLMLSKLELRKWLVQMIVLNLALLKLSHCLKIFLGKLLLLLGCRIDKCFSFFVDLLKLAYLVVETNSRLCGSCIIRNSSLRADFRNEGAWVNDLQLWCDAGQATLLGNAQGRGIIFDHHNFAESVDDQLLQSNICIRLQLNELENAFGILWNRWTLLKLNLIECLERVDVDHTTFDLSVERKKLLCLLEAIYDAAE